MSPREKALLAAVVIALAATVWNLREERRCAARQSPPQGPAGVEQLSEELTDSSACIRSAAAFDLQKAGINGAHTVPRLTSLLNDSAEEVRWRAAAALGEIGVAAPNVSAALISALQDNNSKVRYNTIYSLGKLQALEATHPLADLANDADIDVRHNAIYTLRFVALVSDRAWLCPILEATLKQGQESWLVAAESAGLIGCTDLAPAIGDARTKWLGKCPEAARTAQVTTTKPAAPAWALRPDIGTDCGSADLTVQILESAERRLTLVRATESAA